MNQDLDFADLLRLIDERSQAFRAALAAVPSLELPVPTCPGWTLRDLAAHLGDGRRAWAATIDAGPTATTKSTPKNALPAPPDREALLEWSAAATQELLVALTNSGPDRSCWTWWGGSQSPQTSGAVGRHQLQEIAVHTYDAQLTVGVGQPLPVEVALDGVEEFLFTCNATTLAWPHAPAAIDYVADEGRSWRLRLSANGAYATRTVASENLDDPADAGLCGSASRLVLTMYGRAPVSDLEVTGKVAVIDQLVAWDPA